MFKINCRHWRNSIKSISAVIIADFKSVKNLVFVVRGGQMEVEMVIEGYGDRKLSNWNGNKSYFQKPQNNLKKNRKKTKERQNNNRKKKNTQNFINVSKSFIENALGNNIQWSRCYWSFNFLICWNCRCSQILKKRRSWIPLKVYQNICQG